jgi:hypothetical protein
VSLKAGNGRIELENYIQTTDLSFLAHESTANNGAMSPTTACTDTLAEFMRGSLLIVGNTLVVNPEELEAVEVE